MVDAVRSDPPTLTFSTSTTESIIINVTNPTPTSGRPTVLSNSIYRKVHGSASGWTYVGTTGPNNSINDPFLRASTSYDYFARTDTGADSLPYQASTPAVSGFWMHDPNDVLGTVRHFPYGAGNDETLDEEEVALQFVGRQYPVVEAGVLETQVVTISAQIPFSDTDWREQAEWFRARKRAKATVLYRDGRGRMFAGRLLGALTLQAVRQGYVVTSSLQRVDYTANTIILPESYYTNGTTNDGGNGIYGNGSNGNGY